MRKQNKRRKTKRKRNKRKKRVSKLFVSTAAFFSAAVVVIFCIYYVAFDTDYFNVVAVDTDGNNIYDDNYIIEKSGITLGEKIFNIDRKVTKENLEKEVYIKEARVVYQLPNRIFVEIEEREEKYQIKFNNEYIITDEEGIVLNIYNTESQLLTIESFSDLIYYKGDIIVFNGIEDSEIVFDTLKYCISEYGSDKIIKFSIVDSSILLDTNYGTEIKLNIEKDMKYQISFAMQIINERLNNNLTVNSDLIDFTKGDSPVYVEGYQLEEIYE